MDPSLFSTTTTTPLIPEIKSKAVLQFLKSYDEEEEQERKQENTANIKVSRAASALAVVYEKLRQVIDYQDEAVLRRRALERILLRRLTTAKNGEHSTAEGLIKELTWGNYIDNNTLPQERIGEVAEIIKRYKVLLEQNTYKQTKKLPDLRDWILGAMSSEIEETLVPHHTSDALVHLMYSSIDHSESTLQADEATKNLQLYLAIQRALLKSDNAYLRYKLLTSYYPGWTSNDPPLTAQVAQHFIAAVEAIEFHLHNPLGDRFYNIIRKQTAPFTILKAVVDKNKKKRHEILAIPEQREEAIREECEKKYSSIRVKIRRAATRSIIYLFITKMTLAFIIELPTDRFLGEIKYLPLGINILFPPMLMFLVSMTIRPPDKKNTEKIVSRLNSLIDDTEGNHLLKLKLPAPRTRSTIYVYVYIATFIISFGIIWLILSKLGFNFVSKGLFFLFTCLVSFFAFRIRQTSLEMRVVDEKESFFSAIIDFFFLPFLRAGQWMARGFSKINIFIFIFDFILEAPWKSLVSIFEEWFSFIREKKEEIV